MSCNSTRASDEGLSSLPRTVIERLVVSAAVDGRRPYCAYEQVESMVKRMVATAARIFIFPTLKQNGCDLSGLRKLLSIYLVTTLNTASDVLECRMMDSALSCPD